MTEDEDMEHLKSKIIRLSGNMRNHEPEIIDEEFQGHDGKTYIHMHLTWDVPECKCTTPDHRDGTPLVKTIVLPNPMTYEQFVENMVKWGHAMSKNKQDNDWYEKRIKAWGNELLDLVNKWIEEEKHQEPKSPYSPYYEGEPK